MSNNKFNNLLKNDFYNLAPKGGSFYNKYLSKRQPSYKNIFFGCFQNSYSLFLLLSSRKLNVAKLIQSELSVYFRYNWFADLRRTWNGSYARPSLYMPRLKKGLSNIVPRFERFWSTLQFIHRYVQRDINWSLIYSLNFAQNNLNSVLLKSRFNLLFSSISFKEILFFKLVSNLKGLNNYEPNFMYNNIISSNFAVNNPSFITLLQLHVYDNAKLELLNYFYRFVNKLTKNKLVITDLSFQTKPLNMLFYWNKQRWSNKIIGDLLPSRSNIITTDPFPKGAIIELLLSDSKFSNRLAKNNIVNSLKYLYYFKLLKQNTYSDLFTSFGNIYKDNIILSKSILKRTIYFNYKSLIRYNLSRTLGGVIFQNSFWHTINLLDLWFKFKNFVKYTFAFWAIVEDFNKSLMASFNSISLLKSRSSVFLMYLLFFSSRSKYTFKHFVIMLCCVLNDSIYTNSLRSLNSYFILNFVSFKLNSFRSLISNPALGMKNLGFFLFKLKELISAGSKLSLSIRENRLDLYFSPIFPIIRSVWNSWMFNGSRSRRDFFLFRKHFSNEEFAFRSLERTSPIWKRNRLFLRQKFWRIFQVRKFLQSLEDSFVSKFSSNSYNSTILSVNPSLLEYTLLNKLKLYANTDSYLASKKLSVSDKKVLLNTLFPNLLPSLRSSDKNLTVINYNKSALSSFGLKLNPDNIKDLNVIQYLTNDSLSLRALLCLNKDLLNPSNSIIRFPFGNFFKFLRRVNTGRILEWLSSRFFEKELYQTYLTPVHFVGGVDFVYFSRRHNSYYISYNFGIKQPLLISASELNYNKDSLSFDRLNNDFSMRSARVRVEQRLANEISQSLNSLDQLYPMYTHSFKELLFPVLSKRMLCFKNLWLEYLRLDISELKLFVDMPKRTMFNQNCSSKSIDMVILNYHVVLYNAFIRVYEQIGFSQKRFSGNVSNMNSFGNFYYSILRQWFWFYISSNN